ncbi:hypothetical protein ACOMHN_053553 [Nucella lapillus]
MKKKGTFELKTDLLHLRTIPERLSIPQKQSSGPLTAVKCLADRTAFSIALRVGKTWAQKMADSSSHVGPGILDREMDLLGIRDDCLSVEVPSILNFHPQYCVASLVIRKVPFPDQLKAPSPTGLSIATCLPSTCHQRDVSAFTRNMLQQRHLTHMDVEHVLCSDGDEQAVNAAGAGMATFLCLWVVLVLVSTALHSLRTSWPRRQGRQVSQQSPGQVFQQSPRRVSQQSPRQVSQQSPRQVSQQSPRQVSRRTPRRVHYHREQESQPHDGDGPSESSMVTIEFNIDSDAASSPKPHQLTDRSVPKCQPSQGKRRGILRKGNPHVSLLRSENARSHDELSNLKRLIRCFSAELHLKKLLDTTRSKSEIGCLHSILVLSFAWLVLAESVLNQILFVTNTFPLFKEWRHHRLLYSIISNGHLSNDSLFTVSGISVRYVYSFQLDKRMGKMNWVTYLLTRYWKIVPSMVMVGLTYLSLFPDVVSGPLGVSQAPDQNSCLHWGWINVLLIHNFAPEVCLPWTWFLAVDFQLFLLKPLLLLLLYHRPRAAYLLVCVLVLASWIANGILTRIHHVPVTQFVLPGNTSTSNAFNEKNFASRYLYKPWTHAGSFYPPLLLGFLLHRSKRRGSFRWWTLALGWLMVFAASMIVVFGTSRELVGEGTFSTEGVALYTAVQGTVWSLCVCWLVLVCTAGYGGPLNSLLSWAGWRPLSRLVLGGYLVYPVILVTYNACLEELTYGTTAVLTYHFLGVFGYSLLLAGVLSVTVEMPFNALLSVLFPCCVTSY